MSNPAHLWLTNENGSPVVGSCQMLNRIGSIEVRSVHHHVWLPADKNTGRLTGTRLHTPIKVQKSSITQHRCFFVPFVKEEY